MDRPLSIAPGVREVASEDGAVLLDIEQGICFSLNPVGLRIWRLLREKRSREEIVDALAQEFAVPRTQLAVDTSEFLASLEGQHLTQSRPPVQKRSWIERMILSVRKLASR